MELEKYGLDKVVVAAVAPLVRRKVKESGWVTSAERAERVHIGIQ